MDNITQDVYLNVGDLSPILGGIKRGDAKGTFAGKPIDEMTRDQLLAACIYLGRELGDCQKKRISELWGTPPGSMNLSRP